MAGKITDKQINAARRALLTQKQVAVKLRFGLSIKIEVIRGYRIATNGIIKNMLNNMVISFHFQLEIGERLVFILNFQTQPPGSLMGFYLGMQDDFLKGFGNKIITAAFQAFYQALFIIQTGNKQDR